MTQTRSETMIAGTFSRWKGIALHETDVNSGKTPCTPKKKFYHQYLRFSLCRNPPLEANATVTNDTSPNKNDSLSDAPPSTTLAPSTLPKEEAPLPAKGAAQEEKQSSMTIFFILIVLGEQKAKQFFSKAK